MLLSVDEYYKICPSKELLEFINSQEFIDAVQESISIYKKICDDNHHN